MDENVPHIQERDHRPVRHEVKDVKVQPIVWFCLGLLLLVILSFWITRIMFDHFAAREARSAPPPLPLVSERPHLPPEPRLQITPVQDRKRIFAAEENILDSYGWVNQPLGIVRIPIDRAMHLIAQRGLPSVPAGGERRARSEER